MPNPLLSLFLDKDTHHSASLPNKPFMQFIRWRFFVVFLGSNSQNTLAPIPPATDSPSRSLGIPSTRRNLECFTFSQCKHFPESEEVTVW